MLVLTDGSRARMEPQLTGYKGRQFPFRVWWVREYGKQSIGGWWRWFTRRKPWNPTGGLPEWLYTRGDISASSGPSSRTFAMRRPG